MAEPLNVESVIALREELWDAGFRPVPIVNPTAQCASPGKKPGGPDHGHAWAERARLNPPLALSWRSTEDLNTGILCDGLRAVDIDVDDAEAAKRIRAIALFSLGDAPCRYRDNSSRVLLLYRASEGQPHKRSLVGRVGKIEILGFGNQFVAYGTHHTGAELRWMPDDPRSTPRETLQAVTEAQLDQFFAAVRPLLGEAAKETVSSTATEAPADVRALMAEIVTAGCAEVASTADLPDELRSALDAAIVAHPRLAARWKGETDDLIASGKDASRSGRDMSMASLLKGARFKDTEAAIILLAYEHGAAHDIEKHPTQAVRLRYVARTALRSGTANLDPPQAPEPPPAAQTTAIWADADGWDPSAIPKRAWLAPGYLLRGSVSALSAQGAGGKSTLVVRWTIASATGEPVGAFVPTGRLIVANYNVEDDEFEQRRRYSAALQAAGLTPEHIAGRVIRCGPRSVGTLFERDPATGRIKPTAAMDRLERLCMERQVDVLVCDPLAELHNAEENDNTAMRAIVAAFRDLAQRLGIAVLLLHHDRKGAGAPGDMDRIRGASAITGAVRVLLTLTTMSQDEAEKFGVKPEDRRRHFRIDGAKSNYAPAQEAEWWRISAYPIANGEDIAAASPWSPPSAFGDLSMAECVRILDALHAGTPSGLAWAAAPQAKADWAGQLLVQSGRTEKQAAIILAAWESENLIRREELDSPRRGHKRWAYVVNSEAVAEMRRDASFDGPDAE